MVEIEVVGPDGCVHYRRPEGHSMLDEARANPSYSLRIRCPDCYGQRARGVRGDTVPKYCGANGCDFERPGYQDVR